MARRDWNAKSKNATYLSTEIAAKSSLDAPDRTGIGPKVPAIECRSGIELGAVASNECHPMIQHIRELVRLLPASSSLDF
jgi:hypothetical protein